jgi:serine/threonine-protein kinase
VDRDYVKAFGESGLGNPHDAADEVAARVRQSAIHLALVAALDDWAVCAADPERRKWLLTVARVADPDPQGWRDRIRDPDSWEDAATLAELSRTVPLKSQSVPLLLALAERIGAAGEDMPAFLRRVQYDHPADFFVNLFLGDALLGPAPVEAGGYYRAALASRPNAAVVYTSLGDVLRAQKSPDEAIGYYRRAVQIDPRFARGHTNLGNILNDAGRIEDAVACYRTALEGDPNYAWAHFDLANTLRSVGQMEEAVEQYRQYNALDASNPQISHLLRADLVRRGNGEQVFQEWKEALKADPPGHDPWWGYAELSLFLGHNDAYGQARRDLLRRFGETADPYVAERTARASLLMPAEGHDLELAASLAARAVAAKETTPQWIYPYFLFAQGLAEYRQGHFDNAISIMESRAGEVMGPCPGLVVAMARHGKGETQEARRTLSATIARTDWAMAKTLGRDDWISHILRREAEARIFPDSAAVLDGRRPAKDNAERLALLGTCRFKDLNFTSARLYADAFAADPTLVDDGTVKHRFNAALAALLTGFGVGGDSASVSAPERERWRQQARQWVAEELEAGDPGVQRASMRWQANVDLAGLRVPAALDGLPADEREGCRSVLRDIDARFKRAQRSTVPTHGG